MTYISQDLKDELAAEVAAMVNALASATVVDVPALQAQVAALQADLVTVTAERDALAVKIANAQAALA